MIDAPCNTIQEGIAVVEDGVSVYVDDSAGPYLENLTMQNTIPGNTVIVQALDFTGARYVTEPVDEQMAGWTAQFRLFRTPASNSLDVGAWKGEKSKRTFSSSPQSVMFLLSVPPGLCQSTPRYG